MKNKLKLIIVTVIMSMVLVGCGAKSPTKVVDEYFTQIQKGENADVKGLLDEAIKEQEQSKVDSEKETSPELDKAMSNVMSKIAAKSISETINEDTAIVEVELSGVSFAEVFTEYLKESFGVIMSAAFNGEDTESEEFQTKIEARLIELLNSAEIKEKNGKVNLKKVDKEWKIQLDDDLTSLLLG